MISVLLSSIQPSVALKDALLGADKLLVKKPAVQASITKRRRDSQNHLSHPVDSMGLHQPKNMRQSQKSGVFFTRARISLKFGSDRATLRFPR